MKKIIFSTLVASSFLFAADYTNSIGMVFKEIPSGSFMMGTPTLSTADCPKDNPFTAPNEYNDCVSSRTRNVNNNETPVHSVTVASFYMSETEVTQGQWYEIMGDNPANFKTGNVNMPIELVSLDDTKIFIKRLNAKEGGDKYRLPTEEEWEYAARAGTTTKWSCGDSESCVSSIAVYNTTSPKPVKSKKPNAFGLYDMSGNVWEWTESCWTSNYNSGKDCEYKVMRGGGWSSNNADCIRSAYRGTNTPSSRTGKDGFRLLRMK
ncbi:formylglycine-generating enzyme family protein [Sulfurimonas sp.]|uniref:formylglycine-generating enzyme family protein n=1 Tax=Sulfurimonas sp. TaxID=2022749 RepID=UPI00345C18F3